MIQLSELIEKLTRLQEQHGPDLLVVVSTDGGDGHEADVESAEFNSDDGEVIVIVCGELHS